MTVAPTASQINAFAVTERVASIFSLFGILFILSTFLLARGFDKPINRLIFFASWSNLGMNIASLIAQDGITAGQNSSLCQFQGFAVQFFLGVDVFWALCMAINVYLALFRDWTASRMRAQEWKYFIGCYGAAFIPAFVYLFVQSASRGKVYGPALLWCWIAPEWDFLRVATLYGIVWLAILFAFSIYALAFNKVWHQRHELRGLFNPFNEDPFANRTTVTTEINVVSAPINQPPSTDERTSSEIKNPPNRFKNDVFDFTSETAPPTADTNQPFDPYSVDIESTPLPQDPNVPSQGLRDLTRQHALSATHPDAWLYARVAFLFFCALLISWLPASINRLYSLANPQTLVFGLNLTETIVLPLQGFFNALVYIVTSQTACRNLWKRLFGGWRAERYTNVVGEGGKGMGLDAPGGGSKGRGGFGKVEVGGRGSSSESVAELTEVHQHLQRHQQSQRRRG